MGLSSYNEPVKYEAPPPRAPMQFPRWLIILVLVVAGLGVTVILLYNLASGYFKSQLKGNLPKAAVVTGSSLQWRVLATRRSLLPTQPGAMGGLVAADFDADGDDEILLISGNGNSEIFEVDGTGVGCGLSGMEFMMGAVPWDYDRDGIAELVVDTMWGDVIANRSSGGNSLDNMKLSEDLPVYDLSGSVVARLPAVATTAGSMKTGDIDGDGFMELLAPRQSSKSKYGSEQLVAFGKDGKAVWKPLDKIDLTFGSIADIDADGRDEIVFLTDRLSRFRVIGLNREPAYISIRLSGKDKAEFIGEPTCMDLNADGIGELVMNGSGILHPEDGTFDKFDWPVSEAPVLLNRCCSFDLNGDGNNEVALSALVGSALYVFDYNGDCKYYEEFGDLTMGATAANANGTSYIVVQFMEKLLIYP